VKRQSDLTAMLPTGLGSVVTSIGTIVALRRSRSKTS